jgi:hypothetical protein
VNSLRYTYFGESDPRKHTDGFDGHDQLFSKRFSEPRSTDSLREQFESLDLTTFLHPG